MQTVSYGMCLIRVKMVCDNFVITEPTYSYHFRYFSWMLTEYFRVFERSWDGAMWMLQLIQFNWNSLSDGKMFYTLNTTEVKFGCSHNWKYSLHSTVVRTVQSVRAVLTFSPLSPSSFFPMLCVFVYPYFVAASYTHKGGTGYRRWNSRAIHTSSYQFFRSDRSRLRCAHWTYAKLKSIVYGVRWAVSLMHCHSNMEKSSNFGQYSGEAIVSCTWTRRFSSFWCVLNWNEAWKWNLLEPFLLLLIKFQHSWGWLLRTIIGTWEKEFAAKSQPLILYSWDITSNQRCLI